MFSRRVDVPYMSVLALIQTLIAYLIVGYVEEIKTGALQPPTAEFIVGIRKHIKQPNRQLRLLCLFGSRRPIEPAPIRC